MWKFRIEIFTRCGGSHSGSRRLLVVVVVTVHVLVVVIYILVFVFLIPYRPVAATRTVQCLVTEQRSAVGRRRQLRLQYLPSENDGFNENFFFHFNENFFRFLSSRERNDSEYVLLFLLAFGRARFVFRIINPRL